MPSTTSNLFIVYGGLLVLAAVVCLPNLEFHGVFTVLVVLYGMLVATNGLDRGEKKRKRRP
jgi:hypothetical protein